MKEKGSFQKGFGFQCPAEAAVWARVSLSCLLSTSRDSCSHHQLLQTLGSFCSGAFMNRVRNTPPGWRCWNRLVFELFIAQVTFRMRWSWYRARVLGQLIQRRRSPVLKNDVSAVRSNPPGDSETLLKDLYWSRSHIQYGWTLFEVTSECSH